MVDLNATGLENARKLIALPSDEMLTITGDISNSGFAQKVFDSSRDKFGSASSILVNCAAIVGPGPFIHMTDDNFQKVVDVNLHGTFKLIKAFLSQFDFDKQAEGLANNDQFVNTSIVNVSSLAAKTGMFYNSNYAASKGAVVSLTKTICIEMAKYGVRCNAVLPTLVDTPMASGGSRELQKYMQSLTQLNPMRRVARPDEVANVCLFLASDQSSYVNGTSVEVSGGFLA